jgi:nucleotide-binding universal stress UspA family protein
MLPIRSVLWPTDFSGRARRSLDVACELAGHFGARIEAAHVLASLPGTFGATASPLPVDIRAYQEALEEEARRNLDALLADAVPDGVAGAAHVMWGEPAHELVRLAAELEVDLVVIATRGETGLSRFVSGSVTEKVVRLARCPVLTVQPHDAEEPDAEPR